MFRKLTTTLAISALLISGVGPALGETPIAGQPVPVIANGQVAEELAPLPAAGATTVEEAQLTPGQWWTGGAVVATAVILCLVWWCDSNSSSDSNGSSPPPPPPPSGTN